MFIIDYKFYQNIVISSSICPSRYYTRIENQSENKKSALRDIFDNGDHLGFKQLLITISYHWKYKEYS